MASFNALYYARRHSSILIMSIALTNTSAAFAEVMHGPVSLEIPAAETIDSNAVDLMSGKLRLQSPTMSINFTEGRNVVGLEWNGEGWRHLGTASLWMGKNKHFYVQYTDIPNGRTTSYEFDEFKKGVGQLNGRDDVALVCSSWSEDTNVKECTFYDRNGDTILFQGSPRALATPSLFNALLANGNLAIDAIYRTSPISGGPHHIRYSTSGIGAASRPTVNLIGWQGQTLRIDTPNNSDAVDHHYLRPRNVIQVFTDEVGNQWRYHVNNDRQVTRIQAPNVADIAYTYDGDQRVTTATNASGVWRYSYQRSGDILSTTMTNPLNQSRTVRADTKRNILLSTTDELGHLTIYGYDSDNRLTSKLLPDGSSIALEYDSRGNVLRRTTNPAPSIGGTPTVERSVFPQNCSRTPTCNRPSATIDANGNQTDYEYDPSNGLLTALTLPADTTGQRAQTRFFYGRAVSSDAAGPIYGAYRLTETRQCAHLATCTDSPDEIRTVYERDSNFYPQPYGIAVTTNGQTLRTCFTYDRLGNQIAKTLPAATSGTCPTATRAVLPAAQTLPAPPSSPSTPTTPSEPRDPPCGRNGVICQ